ncbi:hypothetical protein Ancab_035359 [Ancistrocladus abbreviatus]
MVDGYYYGVTTGENIKAWMNLWIPSLNGFKPTPRNTVKINPSLTMMHLMNEDGFWDKQLLENYFDDNSVEHILKMPIICRGGDKLTWMPDLKAMACLKVVKEVQKSNYREVSILGDCKLVNDVINNVTIPPWSIVHIISHVQWLSAMLVDVESVFVGHSLNVIAHELCTWGKALGLKAGSLNTLPKKVMPVFEQENFGSLWAS